MLVLSTYLLFLHVCCFSVLLVCVLPFSVACIVSSGTSVALSRTVRWSGGGQDCEVEWQVWVGEIRRHEKSCEYLGCCFPRRGFREGGWAYEGVGQGEDFSLFQTLNVKQLGKRAGTTRGH